MPKLMPKIINGMWCIHIKLKEENQADENYTSYNYLCITTTILYSFAHTFMVMEALWGD